MNLRQQWIEALESGKYEQGIFFLKNRGQYCCLGVLCEVAGLKGQEKEGITHYEGDSRTISIELCRSVGLRAGQQIDLASLNDCGANFKYIAQWLRDHDTKPD